MARNVKAISGPKCPSNCCVENTLKVSNSRKRETSLELTAVVRMKGNVREMRRSNIQVKVDGLMWSV